MSNNEANGTVVQRFKKEETSPQEGDGSKEVNCKKKAEKQKFIRVYQPRESLYFALAQENNHIAAFFNLAMSLAVLLVILDVTVNSMKEGTLSFGTAQFTTLLGTPLEWLCGFLFWLALFATYALVFVGLRLWVVSRRAVPQLVDPVFVLLFVAYHVAVHGAIQYVNFHYGLSFYTASILTTDQVRLSMKSYSFVRENAYKVLYPWKTTDTEGPHKWYRGQMKPEQASFKQFIYFSFAPTFLYRDEYPRTARVNYLKALWHVLEFVMAQVLGFMIGRNFLNPTFELVHTNPAQYLPLTLAQAVVGGAFFLVLQHIAVIHAPPNIAAELLRFADRQFYEDWWQCMDYQTWFRKWNNLVYDWLNVYLYADIKSLLKSRTYNKVATLPAICGSAVVHDYLFGSAPKVFIPATTFMYGVVGNFAYFAFPFRKHYSQFWNLWFLFLLCIGNGLLIWVYLLESYARAACPIEATFSNAFKYRFWNCFFSSEVQS